MSLPHRPSRFGPLRGRAWGRDHGHDQPPGTPPRALVVALVLASASLMLLDQGEDSPIDPARAVLADVVGPAQSATTALVRPVAQLPETLRTRSDLRREVASLQSENAELRTQVHTQDYQRHRLAELDGLTATAQDLGYALVPARVVGVGAAQGFSDTVTIDAGSRAGLRPDLTVVNNDGLVGRVLRVSETTATVLLLVDRDSTVGSRIGESMKLGFLSGRGGVGGEDGRLDLELVDQSTVPHRDDTVLTWGSQDAGPYVSGVPVGRVLSVYSSLRESTQRAVVEPFVDFGSLDLVGVVVPSGSPSDRTVVEADGSLR